MYDVVVKRSSDELFVLHVGTRKPGSCSGVRAVPDYPCGKSGKCHGPRASEGPQEIEKKLSGPWISKDVVHWAMYAKKLGYELGKTVVEPHESGDCIELRMYKLITAANLQSVFQTEIAL